MYFLHKNQHRLLYNKHKKQTNSKEQHTGTPTKEPLCSETLPPLLKGGGPLAVEGFKKQDDDPLGYRIDGRLIIVPTVV